MDPRVTSRNMAMTTSNENVLVAKSMNMSAQTPRKLPFKDATNNKGNELLKSALKPVGSTSRVEKVQKQEPAFQPQQKEYVDLSFSEYVAPANGSCYCCKGNPQKVDEENWFMALAYADNFITNLLPNRLDEDLDEPLSSFPIVQRCPSPDDSWMKLEVPSIPEPLIEEPSPEFDLSMNDISSIEAPASPLEVPDFDDLESSLHVPDYSDEESIIEF